jgi:hypothetical protein
MKKSQQTLTQKKKIKNKLPNFTNFLLFLGECHDMYVY